MEINFKLLHQFIPPQAKGFLCPFFTEELEKPLRGFLSRKSKLFRRKLFDLGMELVSNACQQNLSPTQKNQLFNLEHCVEKLHAASLIIDDIEDQSLLRRGLPTLHTLLGEARALNIGNFLYFYPLFEISQSSFSQYHKLRILEQSIEALTEAHLGQLLDLSPYFFSHVIPNDPTQKNILDFLMFLIEHKTGSLTALSLLLGAIVAQQDPLPTHLTTQLKSLGHSLGAALQMFDDLGNILSPSPKQYEDLMLNRPSWIWAVSSKHLSKKEFDSLSKNLLSFASFWPLRTQKDEDLLHHLASQGQKDASLYIREKIEIFKNELSSQNDFAKKEDHNEVQTDKTHKNFSISNSSIENFISHIHIFVSELEKSYYKPQPT